ncbi:MAG: 30S ribosomal protein S6 [Candidatus Nealsonbacteria bacterium]|nr:30S ribosomal protein S6 [Candidatus Nealsonbacteria bacterium]
MKHYELAYLISANLSPEEIRVLQQKISSFIQKKREGSEDSNEIKAPIKKILAYPIKKEKECWFAVLNFNLNPEKLIDLEKNLKNEKAILRYLILAKPPSKEVKYIKSPRLIKSKPKKVELKEIEKKLEEILAET